MLCRRFQVQQRRWGFLASIFRTVRQGKILFHQEKLWRYQGMCDVAALSVCHRSWDAPGWQPDTKLRAFYYRWILINSNVRVFVKAGICQSLARILALLATGHRDICFLLFFFLTHLSERAVMHTHEMGTRMSCPTRIFTLFFFSSMLGWNSDFQNSWESSRQKENRKPGWNPNPPQYSL